MMINIISNSGGLMYQCSNSDNRKLLLSCCKESYCWITYFHWHWQKFFQKSSMWCWKMTQEYLHTFSNLRKEFKIADDSEKKLGEYVCRLYISKKSNMNTSRNKIFWETLQKNNIISSISWLSIVKTTCWEK